MIGVLGRVALALTLLLGPPGPTPASGLDFDAEGLDPQAVESGLGVRLGDAIDGWHIVVRATSLRGSYDVELQGPGRPMERRTINLVGETDEDRSRELAATLALIIMEAPLPHEPDEVREPSDGSTVSTAPDTSASETSPPDTSIALPRATIGAEVHVGVGAIEQPDPDFGVGLGLGIWLLRHELLQPRVRVRWSRSRGEDLRVDGVSAGAGLAVGHGIRRWWVGALVMPAFKWTRGFDRKPSTALSGGGEVAAIIQYRRPRFVLGLRTGVETTFRPVKIVGSNDVVRWGPVRWLLVLEIGVGVGLRRN